MIKLLEVSQGAFKYYRENVSGNENTSYAQVQRKLTRNMLLAHEFEPIEGKEGILYQYGCMKFIVRNNRVIWIRNKIKKLDFWKLNMDEYIRLSQESDIDEYDTKMDKVKKGIIVNTKRTINKIKWSIKDKLNYEKVTM